MMKSPVILETLADQEVREVIRILKTLKKLRGVQSGDTQTMRTHLIQIPTMYRHHPHHLLDDKLGLPLSCLVGLLLPLLREHGHPQ